MSEPLDAALASLRPALLDGDRLVRAVAAGTRRRSAELSVRWQRAELRPVDLKSGRRLQIVTYAEGPPVTRNEPFGDEAAVAVDELLGQPFANWHVETTTETVQLRVTKKGAAQVHRSAAGNVQVTGHDRTQAHLIDPGDPLFGVLGAGASKRRQVDAFLRALAAAVSDADLPTDRPLRVVDLGCGNAYLTFAAYRYLSEHADVELVGVDLRSEARQRNTGIAADLGWSERVRFVEGSIAEAPLAGADVVLALHACDTATDDALAQGIRWQAPLVLAAPCCHHDLQRQLKESAAPRPYSVVLRHPILRERLGDVLTDAFRAALLRREGYRAEVLQFVDAEYTPRNTMIRAVRSARQPDPADAEEYDELVAAWAVTPYLQTLLDAGR